MKKTFLSILIIFSFFGLFSFLGTITKVEAGDNWYFLVYIRPTVNGQKSPLFSSLEECNIKRTELINSEAFQIGFKPDGTGAYTSYPSECIKETTTDPVMVTGQEDDFTMDDTYTLLAPIGEFKEAPKNIGDYFNTIFKIVIGLCGALAVVMIVIGGVQYMGDESIFGKTEAKSKITSAIFGLIIALGSYALLNTINPDLLGGKGVKINTVSAEIEDTPLLTESTPPGTGVAVGTQGLCPGGLAPVVVGGSTIMNTCSSISGQTINLISEAAQDGISLSGKSYRSNADQIALRNKNCADPINTPSGQCKPPTAKAGSSLHESGLAIDFKCDGVYIQTTDNVCFIWLKNNAGSFLKNYSPEPWHWSTNGH